jgi:hypothetical protein
MNSEPTNFAELVAQRKTSAQETLREVSSEELRALIAKLFLMEHTRGRSRSRTSSTNISQNARYKARHRTESLSSIIQQPTAAFGINTKTAFAGVGLLGEKSLRPLSEIAGQGNKS